MATTKISDVIVPSVFDQYLIERTVELHEIYTGGMVATDGGIAALARGGGRLLDLPFWKDLTGADEVLSDSAALTPASITTDKDQAILFARGRAWGANDLAEALAGSDPLTAVGNLVAEYWFRRRQALLLSSLKGIIADNVAANSGDLVRDVSDESGADATDAQKIGADTVIDAQGTMGDAANKLTAIAMHSDLFRRLQKLETIEYDSAVGPSKVPIQLPRYLGLRVIVDDGLPKVAGSTSGYKYTSFLFGQGAVAYADANTPVPSETDRDALAGEDYLITRTHFYLHVRGIKWTGSSAAFPSNTDCEVATAWSRVYQRKNIRLAALITNG